MANHQSDEVKLAVIQTDINYIKEKLNSVDNKVSSNYVSKAEFEPVRRIVYGLTAVVLSAVAVALVALVVRT